MLTLKEIHTADAAYAFVEHLWLGAFPQNERRDTEAQRLNTDYRQNFHCLCAEDDGHAVGFITYWEFAGFCYGEHLAVSDAFRNHGYGALILAALKEHLGDIPFVLEVEMPNDDLSRRRIGFYRRQGFALWDDCPYVQPPYREGDAPLPMYLMARGDISPERDFARVCSIIHREVYGFHL